MNALEKLIAKLCPEGVEYKPLKDVCVRHHGTNITAGRMVELACSNGGVRVFAAGSTVANVSPSALPTNDIIFEAGIIVKSRGYVGFEYYEKPFTHKNELWSYTSGSRDVDLKFVYYLLLTKCPALQALARSKSVKLPQLATGDTDSLEIPIPPLPIQQEIVRMLDEMSGLIDAMEEELAARKKQYEWSRERLLNFGDDVERKALGEIAIDFSRGNGILRTQVTPTGIQCVRYGEIYTSYNIWFDECLSHTKPEFAASPKYFENGDILFAITGEKIGEIGKTIAYVGYDKCIAGGDIAVMKHTQNAKYLAYALSTADAQSQKSHGKVKSKVVHLSVPQLKAVQIPLPPLPVQQEIVCKLDEMTALISALEEESALRKQQYEYYREKLLTFQRKETA